MIHGLCQPEGHSSYHSSIGVDELSMPLQSREGGAAPLHSPIRVSNLPYWCNAEALTTMHCSHTGHLAGSALCSRWPTSARFFWNDRYGCPAAAPEKDCASAAALACTQHAKELPQARSCSTVLPILRMHTLKVLTYIQTWAYQSSLRPSCTMQLRLRSISLEGCQGMRSLPHGQICLASTQHRRPAV